MYSAVFMIFRMEFQLFLLLFHLAIENTFFWVLNWYFKNIYHASLGFLFLINVENFLVPIRPLGSDFCHIKCIIL